MHRDEFRRLDPHRKIAQESPAASPACRIRIVLEARACPETGGLRSCIKVERLVEYSEIVISHQGCPASRDDQIHAFHRIGPISDDIAETDDMLDPPPLDLLQDGGERLKVAVDIADDRKHAAAAAPPGPAAHAPAAPRRFRRDTPIISLQPMHHARVSGRVPEETMVRTAFPTV